MDHGFFWLTDEQVSWLEPHLPTDTRGKPRVESHFTRLGNPPRESHSMQRGISAGSITEMKLNNLSLRLIVANIVGAGRCCLINGC